MSKRTQRCGTCGRNRMPTQSSIAMCHFPLPRLNYPDSIKIIGPVLMRAEQGKKCLWWKARRLEDAKVKT